jgi:hypothetical protein
MYPTLFRAIAGERRGLESREMAKMRDSGQLETLSSTAALGLWADDVILALDRVTRLEDDDKDSRKLLADAAEIFDDALERTNHPLTAPKSGRSLAATDTALDLVETLSQRSEDESPPTLLQELAETLRAGATGELATDDERLTRTLEFFATVARNQLAKTNSVLSSRKDARAWTAPMRISNFS